MPRFLARPHHFGVVLALLLACLPALGDSWASATQAGVSSPSGQIIVRVIPGTSIGDVHGFAGAPKGKFAAGLYYRLSEAGEYVRYQEVALVNPVAPVFIAVSDSGELVTLDNWHNMGMGKAVVVYRPDGQVLRSWELSQIYGKDELQKMPISVSSVWWRCALPPVLQARPSLLGFHDVLGNLVDVDLKTGAVSKRPAKEKKC